MLIARVLTYKSTLRRGLLRRPRICLLKISLLYCACFLPQFGTRCGSPAVVRLASACRGLVYRFCTLVCR